MILPKFNYIFHNCLMWIPASFFRDIDRCIGPFIWSGALSHFVKSTLQLPANMGGLALPNFQVY